MKKRITVSILISLMLLTCAGQPGVSAQVKYAVIPESPRPGEPVTIGINDTVKEAVLIVDGKQVAKSVCFSVPAEGRKPGFMAAIITIPSTVTAKDAIVKLNNNGITLYIIPVAIAPREFRSETITLNPELSSLVGDPNPQRTAESEKLWAILTTNGNQVYHSGKFINPVTSTRRTSQFGTRRINQYSSGRRTTDIHAGIDFGIPAGTEVYACGRGKVVFSKMRILTGNSVIIEHAPGVYSSYYHLDTLIAEEGSIVEAGETIALSGSTGFSTGPHLHWEIRVSTENTDPDVLVDRPLLDKDLIISKIFN
jgi:murein DD-endopeptidase MepM/ murein hydrolase activator NlpD